MTNLSEPAITSLTYGTEIVPAWAYNAEAARIPHANRIANVSGPASLWAFICLALTVFVWVAIIPLALVGSTCNEHGGLARIHSWVWMVSSMFVMLLIYVEFKVSTYTCIPQIQTAAPFKLLGSELSFAWWFAKVRVASIVGHADIITSGAFVAKVLQTDAHCHGELSWSALAVFGWVAMAGQWMYALALSVPRGAARHPETGSEVALHYQLIRENEERVMYDTLGASDVTHGNAVISLAHACRMTSVFSEEPSYRKASIEAFPAVVIGMGKVLVQQTTRLLVFYILESAYQIVLQSRLLGSHVQNNHTVDRMTLCSLIISLCTSSYGVYCLVTDFRTSRLALLDFARTTYHSDVATTSHVEFPDGSVEEQRKAQCMRSLDRARITFRWLAIFLTVYVLAVVYGCFLTVSALW